MIRPTSTSASSRVCTRFVLLLAALWVVYPPGDVYAQADSSKEHQVKAAFLLNFIQFIEWPAAAFPASDAPIVVSVLGNDPFGTLLEQTFQDEVVRGRKLVVKRSRDVGELKSSHVLFISTSEKERLKDVLAGLQGLSVLTVSEMDGFAERGGIINFYIEGKKVRFEMNAGAAEQKDLKISAQLLKRAKIVSSVTAKSGT